MKRTFKAVLLAALALWVAATLYFVGLHSGCNYADRLDKRLTVDGFSYFEVTEIVFEPRQLGPRYSDWDDIPWYFNLAQRLPPPFVRPFCYLMTFYSNPYTDQPGVGLLRIKGLFVSDNVFRMEDYYPGIYINDVKVSSGWSTSGSEGSNTRTFEIEAEGVPLDNERVELRVLDKAYNILLKTKIEPQWKEKPYFMQPKPKLEYDPVRVGTSLTWFYRDGEDGKLRDLLLPDVNAFPWERLAHLKIPEYEGFYLSNAWIYYQGSYRGYQDVFYVNLTYSFYHKDKSDFEDVAEQNAYLVKRDKEWKIIDVSPLRELT